MIPSPDLAILRWLTARDHAAAPAIGSACRMTPGEVRARLAGLESQRFITGRQDACLVPPARAFMITRDNYGAVGVCLRRNT